MHYLVPGSVTDNCTVSPKSRQCPHFIRRSPERVNKRSHYFFDKSDDEGERLLARDDADEEDED